MSKSITIGKSKGAGDVKLEIGRLIVSRLLVTAASGGGKSWLLRKILEEVSKSTQTIVIDPEGEFASLREKRDMVLAGPGGEVPAEPRSASLLCRRIMEKNVSAVIDISELPPRQRRDFVANFSMTMVELPRSLWRPCIVAIDEIHELAAEGETSESSTAVALLGSKGRKRGYCLLGATQRLSKLGKDVAAELKNVFIGQMVLDVDLKRAAAILGFDKSRWTDLRDLSPPGSEGEFFCFGPAVNHRGVTKFRAGMVETTHPKAGQGRLAAPPEPSKKIVGILDELKDLQQQAEAEIRDLAAAKVKITQLEREMRARPKEKVEREKIVEVSSKRDAQIIARLRAGLEQAMATIKVMTEQLASGGAVAATEMRTAISSTVATLQQLDKRIVARDAEIGKTVREANKLVGKLQELLGASEIDPIGDVQRVHAQSAASIGVTKNFEPRVRMKPLPATDPGGRADLTPTERAVLDAAASFPDGATKQRISIFSGRSIKSSSFQGVFSETEADTDQPSLMRKGLLRRDGDHYLVTDEGAALAEATAGTSLEDWLRKLTPSEAKVLKCLADHAGERLMREQVSEITGQSAASSSFQGAFSSLRDLGLIEGVKDFAVVESLAQL